MQSDTYRISFTSGGLFINEAISVAELYRSLKNWDSVRKEIKSNNTLKTRTASTLQRTSQEVLRRLRVLTDAELDILVEGTRSEQNQILWLAVCKQYTFMHEFAIEVMRERYLKLHLSLMYSDFDAFFNAKSEWNEVLDQVTETTRKKLRQVCFRMMTEAEIISSDNRILPIIISPSVANAIAADDAKFLYIYPINEADIRKYKKP